MTRPLRVLLTADAVGGVWQYATDLAAELPALGVEPVIALTGPAPAAGLRDAAAGVEVIDTGLPLDWLADGPGAVRAAAGRVAQLAERIGADVVQLNAPALAAEVRFPAPVIAVAHSCVGTWWGAVEGAGPLPADLAWREALTRAGLHAADAVVAPSRSFARDTQERHGLERRPHAVRNGRRPLGAKPGATHDYALTVGRLWDRGKNLGVLDRAAARLGMPFLAVGPMEAPHGERAQLDNLIAVGPIGPEALAAKLAPRPVFASAARYEPFGLAVLEAAQAGCPLVLSDIPTFRELWDEAAVFVDPDDAEGFAGAIDALVGDDVARAAAGAAARARAACYGADAMAADMAALYRRHAAAAGEAVAA